MKRTGTQATNNVQFILQSQRTRDAASNTHTHTHQKQTDRHKFVALQTVTSLKQYFIQQRTHSLLHPECVCINFCLIIAANAHTHTLSHVGRRRPCRHNAWCRGHRMVCIRLHTTDTYSLFSCILIALTFYIDSIIIIIVVDITDDDDDDDGSGCGCGCCTGLSAILLNCSIVSTVSTDNMRHKSLTSNSISMGMKKKEENESILPYYASPFTKQICECTIIHTHTLASIHSRTRLISQSLTLAQYIVRQQQDRNYVF